MQSKKLWIWSLIFGLSATIILFLIINSREPSLQAATPPSSNAKTASAENKEKPEPAQTAVSNESNTKGKGSEEDGPKGNVLLPISDGKRAMTIQVSDVQGIAGFIKPDSHVDVVAKLTVPKDAKEGQHDAGTLIIQNARVLAVGHAADDAEAMKRYQMVTLEVNPREGLTLGFSTKYELYLMLRKDGDTKLDPVHTHVHEDELHEGVFLK
ncbi:Flp pilus assembly protein CpaB [Neobacillus piezotolerans]|uniref:Flp pilus assembly protein CpaB n=1 Tax=Neobacillus piezotolerans TaxID=2259171 RepID=A0A3D8GK06_9BACI|nr:Flp pilus assembly protein CpaB [Neobacillus piezotolerans]RDU34661.1 Flp pilus assembly protein CpaB [Neobacillus piezotolerans]